MGNALTARFVETVRPADRRQEIPDAGLKGLYLVVQSSGKKSWAVRYRFDGKPRKYTIGRYPRLSLAGARKEAGSIIGEVDRGCDPCAEKKLEKTERRSGAYHCDAVLDDYIERHIRRNNRPSTISEFTRMIDRDLKPIWKGRDIRDLSRADIIRLLDGILDRGSPYAANQAHAILRRFFRFCLERGILVQSPFSSIPKPAKTESRDRVLTEEEIRAFWRACERLGWPFGQIGQLLLLTGQRRDEVSGALREEFVLERSEWTIPASRAKNGLAHTIHLTDAAKSILREVKLVGSEFMFSTTGTTPVSGWSKAKPKIDRLMEEELGFAPPPWRIHDLRRTAASGMAALNVPPHVVEKILNHRSGTIQGVAAVYNRHEYGTERIQALETWSNRVMSLMADQPENVVQLHKR